MTFSITGRDVIEHSGLGDTPLILMVEDSTEYSAYITDALSVSDGSFRTTAAGSLRDAVARLFKGGIDAVLLDLNLPDSKGLETLHRVHRAAAGAPVVILSGLLDHKLASARLGLSSIARFRCTSALGQSKS